MSYSPEGAKLMIPSHDGMALYESGVGAGAKPPGPAYDYMDFSATRDTLCSCGHPAAGSGMTNPFGLIKSRDGGNTWQKLRLEGESDFLTVDTSYATNAVYVVNQAKNSRKDQPGIYHTRNDGLKWTLAAANGLTGELKSLAAHPSNASMFAVGTANGLYLSRNAGEKFERLIEGAAVLCATFDLDGKNLWFSSYSGKAALTHIALAPGAKAEALSLPALTEDAIAYIAQNPVRRNEMAIASLKRSVFLSKDLGRNWKRIAQNGDTYE